jgi:hypothetical protein
MTIPLLIAIIALAFAVLSAVGVGSRVPLLAIAVILLAILHLLVAL